MQFVETEMGLKIDSKFIGLMGGFVPMEMVVKGMSVCFLVLSCDSGKRGWDWGVCLSCV